MGDLLLRILCWHIIPSFSSVLLTFGFAGLLTRVLKVRNKKWVYWLLLVPLIKGLLVLVKGAELPTALPTTKPFMFTISLWDPLNLLSVPAAIESTPSISSAVAQISVAIVSGLLLVLVWRWVSLFVFYLSLLQDEELRKDDMPRFFRVLDRLVDRMHTRYPKIIISERPYALPCVVGMFRPTLILSPEMVEQSSDEILEATLAHELAHVKRYDNVFHWSFVLLRDLLVINPFAHLVFSRAMLAKEEDCDRIAVHTTHNPKAMAEAIVCAAALRADGETKPLPGYMSDAGGFTGAKKLIKQRVSALASTAFGDNDISWVKRVLVVVLALFGLLVRIGLTPPYPVIGPILQF